ncbi:MAG: hypothetical protein R2860_13805 [Desulfobacterales bacterium]
MLHIQPQISQYLTDEVARVPKVKKEVEKVKAKTNRPLLNCFSEECKSFLVSRGIDAGCVALESHSRDRGIAEDIPKWPRTAPLMQSLWAAGAFPGFRAVYGQCDHQSAEPVRVIPVWVVGVTRKSDRVLAAVDGSSQSLRVVDHLAYIFSGNPDVRFTFLNVEPLLKDVCEIDLGPAESAELEAAL